MNASADETPLPWYFKKATVVMAFLIAGPLALPLVWFHPRYKMWSKLLITVLMLGVTYYLTLSTISLFKMLQDTYHQVAPLLKP